MPLTIREILQVRAHDAASQTFSELIAGAEAVALLVGAVDSGIIGALSIANDAQQIAVATGLDKEKIDRVLSALEAYGLVKQRNAVFRLAPNLELLTSADAPLPLIDTIRVAKVRIRDLTNLAKTSNDYTALQADEVLSIAQGILISVLSFEVNPKILLKTSLRDV